MLSTFVNSALRAGNVESNIIPAFLTEDSLSLFQEAFTHSSYSKKKNYERLEHTGDTYVNLCVALYIPTRFPKINNDAWLSRIKFHLQGKKTLSKLSYENSFAKNILVIGKRFTDEYINDEGAMDILEDVFEAFIGAVGTIADTTYGTGSGLEIAYKLLSHYFDSLKIDITVDFLFDPVTLFKEIVDAERWEYKKTVNVYNIDKSTVRAKFTAPLGENGKYITLGVYESTNTVYAKNKAASYALAKLDRTYGIRSKRHDDSPTVRIPSVVFTSAQKRRFKRFMKWLINNKGMSPTYSRALMRQDTLDSILESVKYCSSSSCIVGPLVLDHAITNFADTVIGEAGEGLKTGFRHEFTKGSDIARYLDDSGFKAIVEDVVIAPVIIDKNIKSTFKVLLGAIFNSLKDIYDIRAAYRAVYRVCIYMFTTNRSMQPKRDSKSLLYNVYVSMKWPLTQGDLIKTEFIDGVYTITVEGFPTGTRAPIAKNRVLLSKASGTVKPEVEEEAYSKAIEKLATRYKIYSRKLFYS